MANVTIDILTQFKGKPAFDKAGKSVTGLEKSVASLGKTFASVFAAQKVAAFGKAAAQAFMEDQKSATLLANTMKNLGLQFANPQVEAFIGKLSAAAGVADDVLRPAMQKLLTTTGSVVNSQKMLADAIDISRGSGVDLGTVIQDLTNAYVGNTKGLKKYNLGLTQAELKASSFLDIQKKLNDQFSGSSAAYLETYAGKMDVLTTAAGEAKETIGKGLIDALAKLSGGTTVEDAAQNLQSIANGINAITNAVASAIGGLTKLYKALDFITSFGGITGSNGKIADQVAKSKEYERKRLEILKSSARSSSPAGSYKRAQAAKAAETAAAKRAKDLAAAQIKATKALTAEQKKQAALKKAGTVFDMEQIQLVAALKGKLSEQDKLRAEAQLALLNGNDAVATKLTKEILASQDATGNLAKLLTSLPNANNPFQYLEAYLDTLKEKVKTLYPSGNVPPVISGDTGNTQVLPQTNAQDYSGFALNTNMPGTAGSGAQFGSSTPWAQASSIVIQIDGKAVAEATQAQSLNGNQTYVDRRTGGFNW